MGSPFGWLMVLEGRKRRKEKYGTESLDDLEYERRLQRDKYMASNERENLTLNYEQLEEQTRHNKELEAYSKMKMIQDAQLEAISQQQSLAKQLQTQISYSTSKLKPGEQEDPMVTLFREKLIAVEGPMLGLNPKDILDAQAAIEPYVAPPEKLEPGQALSFVTGIAGKVDAETMKGVVGFIKKQSGMTEFPDLTIEQQKDMTDEQKLETSLLNSLVKSGRVDATDAPSIASKIKAGQGFDYNLVKPPPEEPLDMLTLNATLGALRSAEDQRDFIANQITMRAKKAGRRDAEYRFVDVNKGFGTTMRLMEYQEAKDAKVSDSELKKFVKHARTPAGEASRRKDETKAALEALGVR